MKKIRISLKVKLMIMSIVPVMLVSMILAILANSKITEGMRQETMIGLQGMANSVSTTFDDLIAGDYSLQDGQLMKGDFNVSENLQVLDAIVEGTDYEVTIFFGKTRMATTLISKETGERIIGTDAKAEVVEAVLENGEHYKSYDTEINGENYYVYYIPIKSSSGEIIGMSFVGIPSTEAEEYISSVTTSIFIAVGVVGLIIIIVTVFMVMAISNSIKSAEKAIDELTEGNLDVEMNLKYLKRSDEIGHMLNALNGYIAKLKDIVGGLRNSSDVMIQSGKKLDEMARVTSKTTAEINNAVGDISKGAVTQAEEIENANVHIVGIGDIIQAIVKGVAQLESTAATMKSAGDESAKIINELSESNDKTMEAIEKISKQVYATNESVQSIREAIAIISSISEETNLLSLNASIEAARAGEHGRGFTVVASEIQQLADQSNESSTRISEIIDELLKESELTVEVMEEVKVIVDNQQRKLEDTKLKFKDVEHGINVCKTETEGIQGQTILCDESREQVVEVIQGLSAISEENAASTEETNASMEELNSVISVMAEAAEELTVLSKELERNLQFFR